jgi:anti-sigma regulatory factor (Ser/Thr protein kinase)
MGSVGEVELEIPARSAYVSLTRQVVAAIAAVEPRFRTDRIDDLRVAVSEATTNAVEAHAHDRGTGRVRITCGLDVDGDCITVEVRDQAGGFDPESVPVVPEPQHPDRLGFEHGLGIPIMRELADETEIHPTGSGTSVRLVVYRSAAAAPQRSDGGQERAEGV